MGTSGKKNVSRRSKSEKISLHKKIKVSIVIPNNGRDISRLIYAIKKQSYKYIEIIIVDEGLERSAQRNIGIQSSVGKYILILDSDQIPTPDLIIECVKAIRCYGAVALYIPEHIPKLDWFARIRHFERQFYNGTAIDCVRFVRKDKCPLFNTFLNGPEDTDWDRRIIGKKLITKNHFIHDDNVDVKTYIKKKKYYTKSMRRFEAMHAGDQILDLKWRCFWVFIEKGKWKRLVRHPRKTLGLIFLLAIRGYIWMKR